jgi:hypothetical protein
MEFFQKHGDLLIAHYHLYLKTFEQLFFFKLEFHMASFPLCYHISFSTEFDPNVLYFTVFY